MTWDRIERLVGSENLNRLSQKRIGVIGLGSGGGFVAQSLAMSGISRFVLVDDDLLEESNVLRHVADRRDIGRPKAEILADLIKLRNPDAEIDVRVGRIEDNMDALSDLDLLIVGVDGEGAKYHINQAILEMNLVAIYAGVYERGEGGDVTVIRPYDGPCYACWAAQLRESAADTGGSTDLDYGMIGPQGTLEAEPGLWIHVARVAAVQADFVLHELLKDSGVYEPFPANTVILANRALEIFDGMVTPPHSAVWVQIERDPQCLVCGDAVRASQSEEVADLSLDDLVGEMGIEIESDEANEQMRGGG